MQWGIPSGIYILNKKVTEKFKRYRRTYFCKDFKRNNNLIVLKTKTPLRPPLKRFFLHHFHQENILFTKVKVLVFTLVNNFFSVYVD